MTPWRPDAHADRRPFLLARARALRAVRAWFEAEGFLETECGALVPSAGAGTHLRGLAVTLTGPDGAGVPRSLHTSPEYAMKKLLAGGERRIVDVARVYRDGERGPLHRPEFTLIEWYRAEAPLEAIIADTVEVCRLAARAGGTAPFAWRGRTCDPLAPLAVVTAAEAFDRFAGIDLLSTLDDPAKPDRDRLAAGARTAGVTVAADDDWSDVFAKVLTERIEPNLGLGALTALVDYPAPEAALARLSPADPRVALRFELYACGVELANGFDELTDAALQRARLEAERAEALRRYGSAAPIDEDFLAALAHMPPASGVALGFDRLAMLAAGARTIHDVMWTAV